MMTLKYFWMVSLLISLSAPVAAADSDSGQAGTPSQEQKQAFRQKVREAKKSVAKAGLIGVGGLIGVSQWQKRAEKAAAVSLREAESQSRTLIRKEGLLYEQGFKMRVELQDLWAARREASELREKLKQAKGGWSTRDVTVETDSAPRKPTHPVVPPKPAESAQRAVMTDSSGKTYLIRHKVTVSQPVYTLPAGQDPSTATVGKKRALVRQFGEKVEVHVRGPHDYLSTGKVTLSYDWRPEASVDALYEKNPITLDQVRQAKTKLAAVEKEILRLQQLRSKKWPEKTLAALDEQYNQLTKKGEDPFMHGVTDHPEKIRKLLNSSHEQALYSERAGEEAKLSKKILDLRGRPSVVGKIAKTLRIGVGAAAAVPLVEAGYRGYEAVKMAQPASETYGTAAK